MNEFLRAFPPSTDSLPLHIALAGITYPDPSYRILRAPSELSVIEYVLSGVGWVKLRGKTHRVEGDSIYFLPRGEDHEYYAAPEEPFCKIFLNVEGALCERLTAAYGLENRFFFEGNGLKACFSRILTVIRSNEGEAAVQAGLQGIFLEILARLSQAQSQGRHNQEALLLKEYLDAHTDRIVTAKELGRVIFRCPDYCLKLFRREFSLTPYAYQLQRKLQIARSLLADTKLSVEEIAASLGYADPHYFSNLFTQKCGCRPLQYRNRR